MYDETTFQNYIFWLKVKRIFLMIVFSIIGAFIGILLSQLLIDLLLIVSASYRVIIISASTLIFFGISLLMTINTSKDIQEGYWRIAVLRKLTVISKKLDILQEPNSSQKAKVINQVSKEIKEEISEVVEKETNDELSKDADNDISEDSAIKED